MFCKSRTIVKQHIDHIRLSPLRCKCWHCDDCVSMRLAELADTCKRGRPNTFITLTVIAQDDDKQAERAQALKRAWTLIRRRLAYQKGWERIPFIAIFEETQKGEPHLHILARMGWVEKAWLSGVLRELTGAYIVDIQRVRSQRGVARYVSKYVSKAPVMWEGTKRYWRSLNWLVEAKVIAHDCPKSFVSWWRQDCHFEHAVRLFLDRGYNATTDGHRWAVYHPELGRPPW